MLATANLPIVWVTAARNDPLLWLTGWSFATYNRFHRWVARVLTLEIFVHAIVMSIYEIITGGGKYQAQWVRQYWQAGVIVSASVLLLLFAERFGAD
jgi:hypothetical protein